MSGASDLFASNLSHVTTPISAIPLPPRFQDHLDPRHGGSQEKYLPKLLIFYT
jgi:hypothetical protein